MANALAVFRREFTAFWGPRMEDAFRFALLTLYEANQAHLRRRPRGAGPASTPSWRCRPSWWTPPSGGSVLRHGGRPGGAGLVERLLRPPRPAPADGDRQPGADQGAALRRQPRRPLGRGAAGLDDRPGGPGCGTGPSCSSTPPRAPSARTPPRWSAPPCSTWWRWPSASRRPSTRGRAGPVSALGGRVPRHARGRLRGRSSPSWPSTGPTWCWPPRAWPGWTRSTASSSGRCARPCSPTWTACSPSTAAPRTPSTWCGSWGAGVDEADLVALGEHRCYARVSADGERLPVFSVRLDPPPASDARPGGRAGRRLGRALRARRRRRRGGRGSALARIAQARRAADGGRRGLGRRRRPEPRRARARRRASAPAGARGRCGARARAGPQRAPAAESARSSPSERRERPARAPAHRGRLFDADGPGVRPAGGGGPEGPEAGRRRGSGLVRRRRRRRPAAGAGWRWRDARAAAGALRRRPADRRALLLLARLPLLPDRGDRAPGGAARRGERLPGACGACAGPGWSAPSGRPLAPGHGPRLFYLTDLGLAAVALDQGVAVGPPRPALRAAPAPTSCGACRGCRSSWRRTTCWRRWRPRGPAGPTCWPGSAPGGGGTSGRRPSTRRGSPCRPTPLVGVGRGGRRRCLLVPDLATFPLRVYRPALARLVALRALGGALPALVVATTDAGRARAWEQLVEETCRARAEAPLVARVVTWDALPWPARSASPGAGSAGGAGRRRGPDGRGARRRDAGAGAARPPPRGDARRRAAAAAAPGRPPPGGRRAHRRGARRRRPRWA